MNFFDHQDRARRSTTRLVVLFLAAIVMIVAAVNAAAYGIMRLIDQPDEREITSPHHRGVSHRGERVDVERTAGGVEEPQVFSWQRPSSYVVVTACTLLLIVAGSLYKTAVLSRGGPAVAEMLGGRPVSPNTAEPVERTLLNVVEEMAIASGLPVPSVYVLDHEAGVNAFAAGYTQRDAVIGVTRGALEHLTRDELQGVIAHEFGHILNGDTRLNLRLIGIVHGILVLALVGYFAMRGSGDIARTVRGKDSAPLLGLALFTLLAGVALMAIGYVGRFFGQVIHAAVSRQREFLADASAVQFTRNPQGLAGVLRKLAGGTREATVVRNLHAEEAAHMFFATGVKIGLRNLLATHPPLLDRIKAIDPTFTAGALAAGADIAVAADMTPGAPALASGFAAARTRVDASRVDEQVGAPTRRDVTYAHDLLGQLPAEIVDAARDPFAARALVFCLLAGEPRDVEQGPLGAAAALVDDATRDAAARLRPVVASLGPAACLPVLDLALPALRGMSPTQVREFKTVCKRLIEADRRVTLFEFALSRIIERFLRAPGERAKRTPVMYSAVSAVADEAAVLLAALAAAGDGDPAAAFHAGRSRLKLSVASPAESPSLRQIDAALTKLLAASPGLKRRVVDALAHCAAADGMVSVREAELLRAVYSTLDCPLPPLFAHRPVAA